MVDNLYVMERLARERYEDQLRMADQRRLQRSAAEAPRPVQSGGLTAWLVTATATPSPRGGAGATPHKAPRRA
jgi:hypothetical protein